MKKKGEINFGIAVGIFMVLIISLSFLMGLIFYGSLIGQTTEHGKHTGQATAIETNGLIFKTTSVYFKSDVQSSQEDRYCVYDEDLKKLLEKKIKNKEKITIIYEDYFIIGWKYCKGSDIAIIVGVE